MTTPSVAPEVRDRVRRLFEFLKRFEERRAPVRRDLSDAEWRLTLSELPRHPSVVRGGDPAAGASGDGEARESQPVLSLSQPDTTDAPRPPALLEGWLQAGWTDPLTTPELIAVRPLADGRTERFDEDGARVTEAARWREKW